MTYSLLFYEAFAHPRGTTLNKNYYGLLWGRVEKAIFQALNSMSYPLVLTLLCNPGWLSLRSTSNTFAA